MHTPQPNPSSAEITATTPPPQARVVIVGGGVMGCALAYHLAAEGLDDVVLLEKGELTSGSTWHAAGQITYSTSHYGLGKCIRYNLQLYRALEAETGQSVTLHDCGSLRMAYTDDDIDWLRQTVSVGAGLHLPMEIIPPERIRELHPFYQLDGIRAALYTPEDGHLDPAGLTFALAKGARQRGVKIIRRCRVTNITQEANGEWQVHSEQGNIRCEHVVNAGGTYARQIALWNGYDLPTTSMSHHYLVTERVPEFADLAAELPVVRDDREISGYLRMEQKSGLIGIYEKQNPNVVWRDGTPWEAENELFEPHYDRIAPWLEGAMRRMPVLAKLGIKRAVHGAISHPPDGNPLIGPAPGLRNYWCCCGCQIGIGWGPGLTRELARWIAHGAADISMREFDPRRFGQYADRDFQIVKAEEDYRLRHELPYPHFSRTDGRPVKTSPLYERLRERGAVYEEVYGWERPRWFAESPAAAQDIYSFRRAPQLHDIIAAECTAVRENAGIIDISAFSKIIVSGKDAAAFVDRLIPNRLPPHTGRIALTHLLSRNGRIELETTVARIAEDTFYFVCAVFFQQRLLDYLAAARPPQAQIDIINRSDEWAALAINGPKARKILATCTPAALDNAAFPWLRAQELTVAGHSLLALRLSYAGELGWELHGEYTGIAAAYDALTTAGAGDGITDYGSFAMNSLRLEKAFMGATELTNEVTLPEAGVMNFVDMNKPDFTGKAATEQALAQPLRWRCVYLEIDSDEDGNGGETVFAGGKTVGVISSIAYGHSTGKLLAFAYIAPDAADAAAAGGDLEVMILGERRPARALTAAAYDAANRRPRE